MNNKKSQIMYFALLGLILVIGAAFIFYLANDKSNNSENGKNSKLNFDATPIEFYIKNCIENIGKNALIYIGRHGGYYNLKQPYLIDNNFILPYYVYDYIDLSPTINQIEREISAYVYNNLASCTQNLEEFKRQGFEIENNIGAVTTQINPYEVAILVNMQLIIKKDGVTSKLEDFKVSIDTPLEKIFNVSKNIINFQIENPNTVCLSCIYDLAETRNLNIDVINYKNNTLIFEVRDYNITEGSIIQSPYNFTFAVKLLDFSCKKLIGVEDSFFIQRCVDELIRNATGEIQVEEIPNLQAIINKRFSHKISAIGAKLQFSGYSELFDITNDGVIDFTPNSEQIGNYSVWISVKDILGNEKFANFNIEVIE